MTETIIVAVLGLIGSLIGTLGGILVANKLSNYRIEQLEKKMEKYNNIVERTFICEGCIKELQHDVIELKRGRRNEKVS